MLKNDLRCTFIRINPYRKDFNIYEELNRIQRHINESAKKLDKESTIKSIIDNVEDLLKAGSKFINNNATVSKFTKNFVRHFLPTI